MDDSQEDYTAYENDVDLRDERFGLLTVLHSAERWTEDWVCRCDCGVHRNVHFSDLRGGAIDSCGCNGAKHWHNAAGVNSPTYNTWQDLKARCSDASHPGHGRGVTYDPRWEALNGFVEDMGVQPNGRSLQLLDAFGNYDERNCGWRIATGEARSKRSASFYTYDEGGPLWRSATADEWANTLNERAPAKYWTAKDVRRLFRLSALKYVLDATHPEAPTTTELEEKRKTRVEARWREEKEDFIDP